RTGPVRHSRRSADSAGGRPVERAFHMNAGLRLRRAPLSGQCVITREIAVAEGVFAPGHLGELTQIVPFEMVDDVPRNTVLRVSLRRPAGTSAAARGGDGPAGPPVRRR